MIWILQQSKDTPPGTSIQWCIENNKPYTLLRVDLEIEKLPLLLTPKDGVIVCGGGMNVDEEHLHSWLTQEKQFIQMCLKQKVPILGLCLGGQLLAEALGARVSKHPHWEIGWNSVEIKTDKLFSALNLSQDQIKMNAVIQNTQLDVFQWHGYSFDTPNSAQLFATNECCKHQGFIYQNFAMGLQFHPESTWAWIEECALSPNEDNIQGTYVQTKEQILAQPEKQKILQKWYFALLNLFFK